MGVGWGGWGSGRVGWIGLCLGRVLLTMNAFR